MAASCFRLVCFLHSIIYTTSGLLLIFFLPEFATVGHGPVVSRKILGSTPHDQLLISVSESLVGTLLIIIGLLVLMVSFVKDREFQGFFAKGCIALHCLIVAWRFVFERKVEALAGDSLRQVAGDIGLAMSWVFFLLWSWREKYD